MSCYDLMLPVVLGLSSIAMLAAAQPAPTTQRGGTCYVSPQGDDRNDGSANSPFSTLERACRHCRQLADGGDLHGWRIVMRGGEYFGMTLLLTERDSGLTIEAADGERPVLYGGAPLRNWQKDGDNFWAAELPPQHHLACEPRMLEVDGQMCSRARWPETGTLQHLSKLDVFWRGATKGGWERKPTADELSTMKYRPEDLGPWLDIKNAELTVYHRWDESWASVASIDPVAHTLRFSAPLGYPPGAFEVYKYVVWNVRKGMTRPGQWYHDRATGRVVYWPLPGQDMSRAKVIVPTVESIIRMVGTSAAPVRDVTLRGLTMHVTTVPLKSGGWAARDFQGAVALQEAENCVLDRLEISRVCGQAIRTSGRVMHLLIENCDVGPCGAGGIYAGSPSKELLYGEHTIHNNHVHGVGRFYAAAIGIMADGHHNVLTHNEVNDCSYSAICCGGVENLIEANLIYHCMQTLEDGAAIYLPMGKRCILRGNFARDVSDHFGASAYYLDETCEDCVVEKNLSLRVKVASMNHLAKHNAIRNNVFVTTAGDLEVGFPRSSDYTVQKNIICAQGTIKFAAIAAVTTWQGNLLYSASNKIIGTKLDDLYRVVEEVGGVVGDSVVADPKFIDVEKGDCRFSPDSPATAMGIEPVDVSRAGRVK